MVRAGDADRIRHGVRARDQKGRRHNRKSHCTIVRTTDEIVQPAESACALERSPSFLSSRNCYVAEMQL